MALTYLAVSKLQYEIANKKNQSSNLKMALTVKILSKKIKCLQTQPVVDKIKY